MKKQSVERRALELACKKIGIIAGSYGCKSCQCPVDRRICNFRICKPSLMSYYLAKAKAGRKIKGGTK